MANVPAPQPSPAPRGRPRNAEIDDEVLAATLAELGSKGYAALSIASVASTAGTTRPAIYRRWKDKAALVVDAVARLAETDPPERTGDHLADLVAELADFRHCIQTAGALPLAGLMLADELEPAVRSAYRERIVAPRRSRLRAILRAAVADGDLSPDADVDLAGSFLTGSWYALHLADRPVPRDWAARVAHLVWRSCGGDPPPRT